MREHRYVSDAARGVAALYGFDEMATPIFEYSNVFKRTLGDTSDIVTKEMYTFTDKGGDEITLRPENTAGVARSFISEGLAQSTPLKFFYSGPMFRYERPQKGRLRQFHQIGVELVGVPVVQADLEVIACGARILDELGVLDKTVLELNTLGDTDSRSEYRDALVDYLQGHLGSLSAESRDRLERNPLRILDSKDEGDRAVITAAPLFTDYLNEDSQTFFAELRAGLENLGIAYELNPRLVRGLDYYCHTAFEFTTTALGAQGAVIAGGRYDGLISMMGGAQTPGVGWAGGIERLSMLCGGALPTPRPVVIVPVGASTRDRALQLAETLRRAGFRIDLSYSGNMSKRMKRANKLGACAAILLGEDELLRDEATIRHMDSGEQEAAPLASLPEVLARYK
jgi:histidyl-tRNA synthetase|tara:strand:+ start:530 stop:1723 length:1194 start_codon:yes stop_codon:yes gene_type:complete